MQGIISPRRSPGMSTATITGSCCAIKVVLFAVQMFGTHEVASVWEPIVIIWLLFIFCSGVYSRGQLQPHSSSSVVHTFFPGHITSRLLQSAGMALLSGLLLALLKLCLRTFSRKALRLSWQRLAYFCWHKLVKQRTSYRLSEPVV
ncbi:hypothetical protein V1522DRAFT_269755 [Lipomyces starkeyi]